jgi:hypothetical protein
VPVVLFATIHQISVAIETGIIGMELIVMDKEAEEVEVPGDLSPISTHPLQKI